MNVHELEMQKLYNDLIKGRDDDQPKLPIVCPTTYNKPCRLCDLAKTILFKKDNEGTPLRQKASSLNRKQAYYSNVVMPTNPSEIVIFHYGFSVFKELMLFQMGPGSEVTDWLDPKLGRNVIITKNAPGGNKQRTTYSTKARINASPLLDMSILKKLSLPEHQLDNIIELIKAGTVKPFYQSQLQEGPNELRFLPSWLGPGITKFFHQVLYHYGLTNEEFELVQRGEYNPFLGIEATEIPQQPTVSSPASKTPPLGSLWEEYVKPVVRKEEDVKQVVREEKPVTIEPVESTRQLPPCYGRQYSEDDAECTTDCKEDGWADSCKILFEEEKAKLEKRKVAKRLIK